MGLTITRQAVLRSHLTFLKVELSGLREDTWLGQARLGQRAAKRPTARKIWQMRLAERVLYLPMQFARLVCFLLGSLPQWGESLSE